MMDFWASILGVKDAVCGVLSGFGDAVFMDMGTVCRLRTKDQREVATVYMLIKMTHSRA